MLKAMHKVDWNREPSKQELIDLFYCFINRTYGTQFLRLASLPDKLCRKPKNSNEGSLEASEKSDESSKSDKSSRSEKSEKSKKPDKSDESGNDKSSASDSKASSLRVLTDKKMLTGRGVPMERISEKNSPFKSEHTKSFDEKLKNSGDTSKVSDENQKS
jgi:hypothetical protein